MSSRSVVGIGRTAEVLAWEDGRVVKLYYDWCSPSSAEYEARVARVVQEAGIPCPKFYGLVEVDGRIGLIYERISGPSLFEWMRKRPWRIDYVARLLAELHHQLHALPATGAPGQRGRLEYKIKNAGLLSPNKRDKALQILSALPDGDRLCHGDFHPGNILMTERGPKVIDWVDVTKGYPLADVGRTALLFRSAHVSTDIPGYRLLLLFRQRMHDIYLRTYARLAQVSVADIRAWDYPLAAARLQENIHEETETLMSYLQD